MMNSLPLDPTPIHLDDLLRSVFRGAITWHKGNRRGLLEIKWVVTSLEEWLPGDLLLLETKKISKDEWKQVEKKELPALVLLGTSDPVILTEKLKFPIISIITDIPLVEAQRQLAKALSNDLSAKHERKLQVHEKLSKLAADGAKLDGLARAMQEISRHGVLIQDKRLNILAECPTLDLEDSWLVISEQFTEIENLPEALQDRKLAGQTPATVQQELSGGISRVITPITVNNVARGYLTLVGLQGTLDALDRMVAEEGALICAMEMSRTKAIRETEKKLQSDLLTALIQQDLSPRDASLWVQAMGLDQQQAHVAMQFAWDAPNPPSRRRLETLINGEIVQLAARAIINPAGKNVICFFQTPADEKRPTAALDFGQRVIEQARQEYPEAEVRCGLGTPALDLNKWHLSFGEAGLALEMAFRLGEDKPLFYSDLSVYRLLLLLEHNPELAIFKHDVLGSLLENESRNDLITTLESYFDHNGNLSRTAEALYIHRNTLTYRLDKIAEITQWDLGNPDTALAVQLALRILRMMP